MTPERPRGLAANRHQVTFVMVGACSSGRQGKRIGDSMMRRSLGLAAVAVIVMLVLASFASGNAKRTSQVLRFKAALTAAQVVPHPKGTMTGSSGTFTATLSGTTLKWKLSYAHLSGPAVAAHIHLGARGKNGIALVALCGPPACKSPMSGTANSVTDDVAALMSKAGAYVNVHTDKNPEGEVRGEISASR